MLDTRNSPSSSRRLDGPIWGAAPCCGARSGSCLKALRECASLERAGTGRVDVPVVLHCRLPCHAVGTDAKVFCLKHGLEESPLDPHSLMLGWPAS